MTTVWIEQDGDLVPMVACAACGSTINERTALVQRGGKGQPDVKICDTTACWRQWRRG